MRWILLALGLTLSGPALGSTTVISEVASSDAILRWINGYRAHPDVARVPVAMRALSRIGALDQPEKAAVYVGFLAGVLAANPGHREELIRKILPLPPGSQWVVVRSIVYSGAYNWQALLNEFSDRLPARHLMIERYLAGRLPRLDQFAIKPDPSWSEKMRDTLQFGKLFGRKAPEGVELPMTPELVDTLWGFYFGSNSYTAIARLAAMLPWSKNRDSVDLLTLGSMARYTLVSNGARDQQLLMMLRLAERTEPERVRPLIADVIEAAETVETARVRKEAVAAIEDLQRKGPNSKRELAWWGSVGEGAIAVGCVAAAVTGQVELGLPCVIGGATTSYALKTWAGAE